MMTWADFKRLIEERGVNDVDLVAYIDISRATKRLRVERTDDGVVIR